MNETKRSKGRTATVKPAIETTAIIETPSIEENTMTKTETAAPVTTAPAAAPRTRNTAVADPSAASHLKTLLTSITNADKQVTVFFTQDNRKATKEPGVSTGAFKFMVVNKHGEVANVTRLLARTLGVNPNVNGAVLTTQHSEEIKADLMERLELGAELIFTEAY